MSGKRVWVEPCAGTASLWLRLHLGPGAKAPVGYMGSKQRLASRILDSIGLLAGESASKVVLADAGCWGRAWRHLADPGKAEAVAKVLDAWAGMDPLDLWAECASEPIPEGWTDGGESLTPLDIAHWLWIQARANLG